MRVKARRASVLSWRGWWVGGGRGGDRGNTVCWAVRCAVQVPFGHILFIRCKEGGLNWNVLAFIAQICFNRITCTMPMSCFGAHACACRTLAYQPLPI